MALRRFTSSPVGRWFVAIVVVLFASAAAAFRAIHHHDHFASGISDGDSCCNICLDHATGSVANVSVLPIFIPIVQRPVETVFLADETIVSHAPLTADSRGPPAIL
jgi:hypothetical protein